MPVSKEKRIDGVGIPDSKAKLPGPTAHRYTVQGCPYCTGNEKDRTITWSAFKMITELKQGFIATLFHVYRNTYFSFLHTGG